MASTLINYSWVSPTTNPCVRVRHLPRRCPVSMIGLQSFFPKNRALSFSTTMSMSKAESKSSSNSRVFELYPNLKDNRPLLHQVFWYLDCMVAQGYKPDDKQANQLLIDLCISRKFEKAARALELMMSSGCTRINLGPMNAILFGLCSNGDISTAVPLVEKLEDNGFSTNPATYNALLDFPFRRRNFNQGYLIMDWLIQRGFVPNSGTCAILLDAVCNNSGVDEAVRLLDFIISKCRIPVLIGQYNTLLSGFCGENRVDEAMRFFKTWPSIGITPNFATYNILMCALCLQGRWDEVNELVPEIVAHSANARAQRFLVGLLSHHGRTDDALKLIDEMLRKRIKPSASCYDSIILHLSKESKIDDVVKCLDQMISRGCEPNDRTYNAIAVLCEQGMLQQAFSIIKSLSTRQKFSSSYDFYNNVLLALCKKGNTYPAFQLLYEMTKCGFTPSPYTYSTLLKGLCKETLGNVALQILQIMEQSGYEATLDNYNALISGLCVSGKVDLGLGIITMMIEKGCMPDVNIYEIIVQGIVRQKEEGLASLVLRELYSKQFVDEKLVERLVWENDLEDYFG